MKIQIHDHAQEQVLDLEGDEGNIRTQLQQHFPWLNVQPQEPLAGVFEDLESTHYLEVVVLSTDELSKSIGYLTFPHLGVDRPVSMPMTTTPEKYKTYAKIQSQAEDPAFTRGAANYNVGAQNRPLSGRVRTMSGRARILAPPRSGPGVSALRARTFGEASLSDPGAWVKDTPKVSAIAQNKALAGTEAHEAQHMIFGRLRQRLGDAAGNAAAIYVFGNLPREERTHVLSLFSPSLRAYSHRPVPDQIEEAVVRLHNYLNDPSYRDTVHSALGYKSLDTQRQSQALARQAWNHMREIAASLKPEHLGLKKSEPELEQWLEAARLLSGSDSEPSDETLREYAVAIEHDLPRQALACYGVPDTDANVAAVTVLARALSREVKPEGDAVVKGEIEVEPLSPDAAAAVSDIKDAASTGALVPVALGGKHSQGAYEAQPESGRNWLIKPSGDGQTPAAGVADGVGQSRREVAFSKIAKAFGIDQVPDAELIKFRGAEAAALAMAEPGHTALAKIVEDDANAATHILRPYLVSGKVLQWAALDLVLGNVDRHGKNILSNGKDIVLIDHGSAFAGAGFDPKDKYTFVPYYLRAWIPPQTWEAAHAETKFKLIPQPSPSTQNQLKDWLDSIHGDAIASVCSRYGIDSEPELKRLARLKRLCESEDVGVVIVKLWLGLIPVSDSVTV